MKVAFLGPLGTYTHQAVTQQFGDIELLPQTSIGDCFEKLNAKYVDYAVVPFENSTNGQVVFTYDLLRDWLLRSNSSFKIVAEQFVSIQHNLLSNLKSIDDIKTIYSHPQVWTQVKNFLKDLSVVKIDVDSTSKAAEIVSKDTTHTAAAISSYMSSKIYNLPILKKNIEDNSNNTTRFLVLGYDSLEESGEVTSSIMLTLNHDDPGALCDILVKFKSKGINLTSINSRPSNIKQWQYVFFIEMMGDVSVIKNELKEICLDFIILGTFKRKPISNV
ncbi:unnamed protein product [Candida verbasci]|uniref:prephenate dehydratase n=1 Tax=Candida verbasci TaxID=1227364 RepID=A0A9W4XLQ0_9ASCO|nr:unnamed protein product [Candida verbasci]